MTRFENGGQLNAEINIASTVKAQSHRISNQELAETVREMLDRVHRDRLWFVLVKDRKKDG